MTQSPFGVDDDDEVRVASMVLIEKNWKGVLAHSFPAYEAAGDPEEEEETAAAEEVEEFGWIQLRNNY